MRRPSAVALSRLTRWVGYRGLALGALALYDLGWAWSLVDAATARPFEVAPTSRVIVAVGAYVGPADRPLAAWAALLAGVGLLCLAQVRASDDRLAFAAAIGLKIILAAATLATWPTTHWQVVRPAAGYLALATLVAACDLGVPFRARR